MTGGWFAAPRGLQGLAGPAGDLILLGLPLKERQERALIQGGARPGEGDVLAATEPGCWVLVREDVAITAEAVLALVARGQEMAADISWRADGRSGALSEELSFGCPDNLLVYLHNGLPSLERIAAAAPELFDTKERLIEVPVPIASFGADVVELPIADAMVLPAGHWLQLLWANLLTLGPFLWRTLAGRNPVEIAWRFLWAFLRTWSLDPRVLGGKLGRRGRGCRVHRSAAVEGCWLGDGVEVGAGAVVRGSVLGDGVVVEDQAMVEFSVLGAGARVQRQALAKFSLLGPRSSVGGAMQLGVLDADASVKRGAMLMDMALGQSVRVMADGKLVDVPLGLAGVCVGARSVLGAGVHVAPGRALPPDVQLSVGDSQVVRTITDGLTGAATIRDGRAVPR